MSANRDRLVHLMAQWHECPVLIAAEGLDRAFGAFKQALAEVVTFRAYEILGLPPEAVLEDS